VRRLRVPSICLSRLPPAQAGVQRLVCPGNPIAHQRLDAMRSGRLQSGPSCNRPYPGETESRECSEVLWRCISEVLTLGRSLLFCRVSNLRYQRWRRRQASMHGPSGPDRKPCRAGSVARHTGRRGYSTPGQSRAAQKEVSHMLPELEENG